ncbi:MAG: M20 family dipeptidase [Deltaproteobacteria bacterium]|nr:M20 family dipeptidase [Deltaproteobacteria bacterium]
MGKINEKKMNDFITKTRKPFENLLAKWVALPTISAESAHKSDIAMAAEEAAGLLKGLGGQTETIETEGHPLVIGNIRKFPDAPTVLIYNHLDVQPAEPEDWEDPPFQPTLKDGRYGGRGSTDNKGPALTAYFAVQCAVEQKIPLNYCFVWEFEEEIGSPHFNTALKSRKEFIRADSILVSDTVWIARDRPAIPFGIRGLLTATLTLETGERDAHSGLVGGAARNPVGELCNLIAQCYDPVTGDVHLPGFYDDLLTSSGEEMEGFLASGFKVAVFKKAHGLKSLRFKEPAKVIESIWSKPTFEVHGLAGGYTGQGVKTVVPPRAEAKISMRLVPRQTPKKIFSALRDFVKERNPDVKVRLEAILDPYLASPAGEYFQAGVEAMTFGFQTPPALIREGGSIGAVVTLNRLLKVPVTFLGLSLPEHGYHAPNEYFEWRQVRGGIRTFLHYFNRISRIPEPI